MEDPANVCKTGAPMSEKGNFNHTEYSCEGNRTVFTVSGILEDHDYPGCSFNILRDSPCDNDAFINNSIQDGFHSEIFSNLVEDAGLQSELCIPESSVEMDSNSDSHMHFSDSPGESFSCEMETFSSMDGLGSSLDEQLDSYLLNGFKDHNSQSTDGNHSLDEQQRNVTEAICDIAKSFGLEDLLPETFNAERAKNLSVDNETTSDHNDENEPIVQLTLKNFDRCTDLNSPVNLENIAENCVLRDIEAPSHAKTNGNCNVTGQHKSDLDIDVFVSSSDSNFGESFNSVLDCEADGKTAQIIQCKENGSLPSDPKHFTEEILFDVTNQVSDIPTVSISDADINVSESCHPAGTVIITTDKVSKKMQIVLTLEQGQQVYDIDTDSVDGSHQAIDLDVSTTSVSVDNAPEQNSECKIVDKVFVVAEDLKLGDKSLTQNQGTVAARIAELVNNIPPPKIKKVKMWICPILGCGQILDKECKLRVHMISHKGVRPFKCSFDGCDWAFTTPYRLRRHEETHLGCKDFICDFEGCNRKFTTIYNLKTHKKRHKWPNSLTCPSKDCEMSFSNRRKLELHLRVHEDVEAPYKCSLCGKQYYSANCIASHYRTHQYSEDDFKCPFGCGKVYDKICRLRQHIRHHTGDRPYACPAEGCKWSFMSASKLTRHMRKHTGERKFICTEPGCGKSFMRPEHLKGHLVIHSGDKPFHCPHENCNAKFTAKSSLYVHVKKHCPSVLKVVYHCPAESCLKKYNSKATLKQHVQKCHPEVLKDGKLTDIEEKLELTMPVSVVNQTDGNLELSIENEIIGKHQNDGSFEFMDLEEIIADDPVVQFESENLNLTYASTSKASMPKVADTLSQKQKVSRFKKETKPIRVSQINKSGCARTDYCAKRKPDKAEPPASFMYLNPNSNDSDARNYILHNQLPTDIKSPDIMLASSIINHDTPDQFLKSHFSSDCSSISHNLYGDESLLVSAGEFDSELIPVSLLSDGVDSEDSVLNSDPSGIVFSDQNSVDAFSEHLRGLD